MKCNIAAVAVLSTALVAASVSTASARDHHWRHGHGFGPFGLIGAAVVGVAAIATLPLRALADAASGPRRDRDDGYDRGPGGDYDGPNYSQQDPRGYYNNRSYQNDQAYAGRGEDYQQPPPGYYPPPNYPPPGAYAPPQNYAPQGYGPPPGYDGPPPGY
jgi:hypothetical protein